MKAHSLFVAALALAGAAGSSLPGDGSQAAARAAVVLDNERVRAYRTTADVVDGVDHGAGVVIWLRDGAAVKAGRAIWRDDVAAPPAQGAGREDVVIVQPRGAAAPAPAAPPSGSKPGEGVFTGMSFVPLFDNARAAVIRARMDVDAREGVHTHASDTIVVHLSGGEIEDTANGKTIVNRWKTGDVEFEGRGTSHSARNIGSPVDVVLVALKP
jgi:quercetin dioxygenase-like cupin family protein